MTIKYHEKWIWKQIQIVLNSCVIYENKQADVFFISWPWF